MPFDIDLLLSLPLFDGLTEQELTTLLGCLHAAERRFDKGAFLLRAGEPPQLGVLLRGRAQVVKDDFWGRRSVLAALEHGALFGESFVFAGSPTLPVSVVASGPVSALFLQGGPLVSPCACLCSFHAKCLTNLLGILANKNRQLTQKIDHITQKTLRGKLLSYLSEQAQANGGPTFAIPFDRQQLADYLSCDRSALSAELSRMRQEGLLRFHKNNFTLHSE